MSSGSLKNVINKMCLEIIYLLYMYRKFLALNNLQWLICQKTRASKVIFHLYKISAGDGRGLSSGMVLMAWTSHLVIHPWLFCFL